MKYMKELITQIYNNAKAKGFHDDWVVEQKLALIISELGEMLEADRKDDYFGKITCFELEELDGLSDREYDLVFEKMVKDTFEDELADIFIRLLDLFGLLVIGKPFQEERIAELELKIANGVYYVDAGWHTYEFIFKMMKKIASMDDPENRFRMFPEVLSNLMSYSALKNIDLEGHIEYKRRYNSHRGYKHGVKY